MSDLMVEPTLDQFLGLVDGRRGHFVLESGYHSGFWLDLDGLFRRPQHVAAFVERLGLRLMRYEVELVCGPMVGGALLAQTTATLLDTEFCFTQPVAPSDDAGLFQACYRLPTAFRSRVSGRRIAIVDDVMSAGSSLRATCAELRSHGATPVVVGALLILGDVGERHFVEQERLPVEAVVRDSFQLWPPLECPLCAQDLPIVTVAAAG
jgi:orotate phosphoribosyltransferase